jgi:tetratricopeptide (TPR) repeat protein
VIGQTLSHYKIVRKLGQGGMGEVYEAEDLKLNRKVALKILPEETAGRPERIERFEREARVVAALSHPNIVMIHSVEADAGRHFLTMELVEGRTLSEHIPRNGLSLSRIFEIAIPMVDAVSAAHEKGITHRDLKPDNVMVTREGRVKVLDFGLAKLFEARSEPGDATAALGGVTEEGRILGTAAYMSPEQAEGKAADPRSDIFSLGIILFEMATGGRPFEGDTSASIIASILRDTPPSVTDLKQTLPAQFGRILKRCLDKDPRRRFQTAVDLKVELEELKAEVDSGETQEHSRSAVSGWQPAAVAAAAGEGASAPRGRSPRLFRLVTLYAGASAGVLALVYLLTRQVGLPDWFFPGSVGLLIIGLPILFATAIVQSRRGELATRTSSDERAKRKPWLSWRKAIAGGVMAFAAWGAVAAAYLVMRSQGIGPAASLVSAGVLEARDRVLIADFENKTDDPLLGGAMKEAFSIDLAQSPMVTLVSPSRVAEVLERMEKPADTPLDQALAREVAIRDGIKAYVAGLVSPAGAGYVLSVRLLSAESDEVLAAFRETAGEDDKLIGAIDNLSRKLREKIGESLKSARGGKPLEDVTTPSLPALQKYSQALQAVDVEDDNQKALALLEEAVAMDSTFAMAHRKIGIILGNMFRETSRQRDALSKAYEYRHRLTDRERYLTEAAFYTNVTSEPERAIASYNQLLDMDPNDTWALNNCGILYQKTGDFARADEMYKLATELDPTSLNVNNLVASKILLGEYDEAEGILDEYGATKADIPSFNWSRVSLAISRGEYDAAEEILRGMRGKYGREEQIGMSVGLGALAAIRGRISESGRYHESAMEMFESMGLGGEYVAFGAMRAAVLIMAGDYEKGVAAFDEALRRFPLEEMPAADRRYGIAAMVFAVAGERERARTFLSRWDALDPDLKRGDEGFRAAVEGVVDLSAGDHEKALREFRRWRESDYSETPDAEAWIGRAFEAAGEADSAVAYYEKYLRTGHPSRFFADQFNLNDVLVRLGSLFEERGDGAKAAHYYGRFVDLWKNADPEYQDEVGAIRVRLERLLDE